MPLRLPNSIGELTKADRNSGELWVHKIDIYLLWFEYLAISPSYEMARRHRKGLRIDKSMLPADFEQVLAVYDDLGDVQQSLFRLWWKDVGLAQFGHKGAPPAVTCVGYTTHHSNKTPNLSDKLEAYFDEGWADQGRQRTMILAVPVGMPEGKINQQIKRQLARIKAERREIIPPPVKYPLVGKRHHKDALMRYLRTVWFRSAMHQKALWRVGAKANISQTYSPVLALNVAQDEVPDVADRDIMTVIASRALLRARMIAENAARGRFPTHANCEAAMDFDSKELRQRIHRRNKWQEREIIRINKQAETL